MRRIQPEECAVLIIDVQEKLATAMPVAQMVELTRAATVLLDAADVLKARVVATEQYPAGLGPTIAPIAERLARAGVTPVAKMAFSACDSTEFERALVATGARTVIALGMETHV